MEAIDAKIEEDGVLSPQIKVRRSQLLVDMECAL